MEKTEVVAKIIEYVGGKDNVVNTWHCMTRLRFELKDTSKIQEDAIKALDGVIGVQFAKGQLQIVLGTSVHKYYDIALQMLDLKEDIAAPAQPEKKERLYFLVHGYGVRRIRPHRARHCRCRYDQGSDGRSGGSGRGFQCYRYL